MTVRPWDQQAVIEAMTGAVGRVVNDFCGLRMSRLTSAVAAGSVVLPMERTHGWDNAGRVSVEGVTYHFTANNDGALAGIYTVDAGGNILPGTVRAHAALAAVIDVSQTYSGLDLVRRSVMSDFAEGDDLSALGRNLGVSRLPDVRTDDQYRQIIQTLAYAPKATMWGLVQALNVLVGPGNYTITEDLINQPCTVFVNVPGAMFLSASPAGRTVLTGPTSLPVVSGGFDFAFPGTTPTFPYARVESIRLKEINVWTDCRSALPSASTDLRYTGDAGVPSWTYGGTSTEGTSMAVTAGLGYKPTANHAAYYQRQDPLLPATHARLKALLGVVDPSTMPTGNTNGRQACGRIRDGASDIAFGLYGADATHYNLALINAQTGALIGTPYLLNAGQYYEVELRKRTDGYVDLMVDGARVDRQAIAAFPSTTSADFSYGIISASATLVPVVTRFVGAYARTDKDFWSASGTDASVAAANPTRLTTAQSVFTAGDVGRMVRVSNSKVLNAQKGSNNAVLFVDTVLSATAVTLRGKSIGGGFVESTHPNRFSVVSDGTDFLYPDDLGKTLVIENSLLGNGGSYTITGMLDPNTQTDLSTMLTPIRQRTNLVLLQGAAFVPETGLVYHLAPAFANESAPLSWDLSDAGSVAGPTGSYHYTITPRQTLPFAQAIYDVTVNTVLSAQVLGQSNVVNALQSLGPPPSYSWWPFYLTNPYNFVLLYLQTLVAAGVKVVFSYQ